MSFQVTPRKRVAALVLVAVLALALALALAAAVVDARPRRRHLRSRSHPHRHVHVNHDLDHLYHDTAAVPGSHVRVRVWDLDLAEDGDKEEDYQPLLTSMNKHRIPLDDPLPHRPHPSPPPPPAPPRHDDPLPPPHHDPQHPRHPRHPAPTPPPPHNTDPAPTVPDPNPANPDPFPHYNLLLSSASRSLFLPPLIFLLLWGVHAIALWAGAAYHDRRRQLLTAHPEARYGPGYADRRRRGVSTSDQEEYGTAATSPVGGAALSSSSGMAPAAEPDLTRREDAERVVAGLVQEVRQTRTVSRPATGGDGEQQQPSMAQRIESATGMHLPSESDPLLGPTRESTSGAQAHVGISHSLLDTPGGQDEYLTDPILTLFSEPDADWGLPDQGDAYERRALIIQPSGVTAVKNGGQVAGMLFAMTLALAVMGTLGGLGMPQPTARDDAVGSRMRVLTLVGVSWGLLGIGLVWVLGEATFLALHDLHRLRSLATLLLFAMMLVYGVALEAENRARLHEMDRIHRPRLPDPSHGDTPPGGPPDTPTHPPSTVGMAAMMLNAPALDGMGWF